MESTLLMDTGSSNGAAAIAFDRLVEASVWLRGAGSCRSFLMTRFRSSAYLALVCGLLALGCSDDDPEPSDCNALENDGPDVTPELRSAGTTPMGGAIVDGQYEQTGFDMIADPGVTIFPEPRTFSAVFEFSSGSLEAVVGSTFVDDEQTDHFSAAYSASGTTLTLDYSCPDESVVEHPEFTATDSEVRLFYRIGNDTATAEVILTKR